MDVIVNIVELASDLAHTRTLYESGDICLSEDEMFLDINSDTTVYTEEIQDRFNEWYDFYYSSIMDVSLNDSRKFFIVE